MSFLSEVQRKDKFGPFVAFHDVAPSRTSLRSLIFVPMTYLEQRLLEECPRQLCYAVANCDGEVSGCSVPPTRKMDRVMRQRSGCGSRQGGMEFCAVSDAAPSALKQLQSLLTSN
jgi:hypothetical protein